MSNNLEKTADRKIRLQVIIECDWPDANYDDVHPDLILEDALIHFDVQDGVKIYLNPEFYATR